MNGWYLHNKEDWPPSTHIHPLFVSVHFNVSAYDTLLSDLSISYLKKYQSIVCALYNDKNVVLANIESYFLSC